MEYVKPNICARCGHRWYGVNPNIRPKRCAWCKSPNWWNQSSKEKYGFGSIQIGGSKLIAWSQYAKTLADRKRIVPAANKYATRHGMKFKIYCSAKGVLINRIS